MLQDETINTCSRDTYYAIRKQAFGRFGYSDHEFRKGSIYISLATSYFSHDPYVPIVREIPSDGNLLAL